LELDVRPIDIQHFGFEVDADSGDRLGLIRVEAKTRQQTGFARFLSQHHASSHTLVPIISPAPAYRVSDEQEFH
jgi:hypothetical protein